MLEIGGVKIVPENMAIKLENVCPLNPKSIKTKYEILVQVHLMLFLCYALVPLGKVRA